MTQQGFGDKTYGLLQVPSQWTILDASQILPVSSSKRSIVYTCICGLRFYERTFFYIFLLYIYISSKWEKQWTKRRKKEDAACSA